MVCVAATAKVSFAGAWTLHEGQGQIIAETSYSEAGRAFGSDQSVKFEKLYVKDRYEYAVTDDVTLFSEPEYVSAHVCTRREEVSAHNFAFSAGGRFLLFSDPGVLSVQGSYKLSQPYTVTASQNNASGNEVEIRLLYGTNYTLFGAHGFADVETAWRWTAPPRPNEAVVDATVGLWIAPNTLAMVQSFNTFSAGYGRYAGMTYHLEKIEASVVRRIFEGWSVQLGGVLSVAGSRVVAERGVSISLWIDV
jgi:protein XagA